MKIRCFDRIFAIIYVTACVCEVRKKYVCATVKYVAISYEYIAIIRFSKVLRKTEKLYGGDNNIHLGCLIIIKKTTTTTSTN